jgi:5-methylcytosine-specific restriction endonuclease McrA
MTSLNYLNAEAIALYGRDGFARFVCKICDQPGFVESEYEECCVCSTCVKKLAHAFIMKHSGEPDSRFAPKGEYDAYWAERDRRKKAGKQPIPSKVRRQVLERDQYRCQECGDHRNLQVDHIFPESKGGTIELGNLRCLCKPCNVRKGSRIAA